MKRGKSLLAVCTALSMCTATLAQHDTKPAQPAKPATPATAKTPADKAGHGMPDMKMMEACMTAGMPGPMHELLMQRCGVWEGTCKMWMTPDSSPTESKCTAKTTPFMNGRFTRCEVEGMMDMGPEMGGPQKFEGFGIYGYDNTSQKFQSSWCDSMGTMIMNSTGTMSPDNKTLTWNANYTCPMTKKDAYMRQVEKMTGPDTLTLEMYGPDMLGGSGKEYKVMSIAYTRKPGTAPKTTGKMESTPPAKTAAPTTPKNVK